MDSTKDAGQPTAISGVGAAAEPRAEVPPPSLTQPLPEHRIQARAALPALLTAKRNAISQLHLTKLSFGLFSKGMACCSRSPVCSLANDDMHSGVNTPRPVSYTHE